MGEWSEVMQPIVAKLEVGANFGRETAWNKEGSAAMAKLLRELAEKADAGIDLVCRLREQLVWMSNLITSRETFDKCDEDELEPIEAMIAEIDAVLSAT